MCAVSKGSGNGDPQILALTLAMYTVLVHFLFSPLDFFGQSHKALGAMDSSAIALRKGRCTSALNTAANVMANPTTFLAAAQTAQAAQHRQHWNDGSGFLGAVNQDTVTLEKKVECMVVACCCSDTVTSIARCHHKDSSFQLVLKDRKRQQQILLMKVFVGV